MGTELTASGEHQVEVRFRLDVTRSEQLTYQNSQLFKRDRGETCAT